MRQAPKLQAASLEAAKTEIESTVDKIRDPTTKKVTYKLEGIQSIWEILPAHNVWTHKSRRVPEPMNEKWRKEISAEEIDTGISSLKSCKSPGTDGFPGEWYKALREQLIPILHKSFNYTQREGVPLSDPKRGQGPEGMRIL